MARHVHRYRLVAVVDGQAFVALRASPGARAYYRHQHARGISHWVALRQFANQLVAICTTA